MGVWFSSLTKYRDLLAPSQDGQSTPPGPRVQHRGQPAPALEPVLVNPPDRPTPDEIQELAARLKPDELLVLPFYHDLKNELVNPERIRGS